MRFGKSIPQDNSGVPGCPPESGIYDGICYVCAPGTFIIIETIIRSNEYNEKEQEMKNYRQIFVILASLFLISACAGTSVKSFEKYNLDNQLEPASEILRYNLMGWETVDNQSLILQTSPSQYYLIVLTYPSDQLMYAEHISISHTGDMVKPGYDKVTVYGSPMHDTYVIEKIYKLKDRDQVNAIREQLTRRS